MVERRIEMKEKVFGKEPLQFLRNGTAAIRLKLNALFDAWAVAQDLQLELMYPVDIKAKALSLDAAVDTCRNQYKTYNSEVLNEFGNQKKNK